MKKGSEALLRVAEAKKAGAVDGGPDVRKALEPFGRVRPFGRVFAEAERKIKAGQFPDAAPKKKKKTRMAQIGISDPAGTGSAPLGSVG